MEEDITVAELKKRITIKEALNIIDVREANEREVFSKFVSFKHCLLFSFFTCISITLIAQEQLIEIPVNNYYKNVEKPALRSSKKPVDLPFIDDFSTTDVYPDPNLWEDQYAFINKLMAVDPPTIGVATLDGLDDEGQPYQGFTVDNAPCDTLTSVTINLSNESISDDIYFSFFYQAGGYADFPDPIDTLVLEFKHEAGWDTIWKGIKSDKNIEDFKQVSIRLSDSVKYLINNFQFRFRNYARPAGHNDFWHIDYVRLGSGIAKEFNDQAFVDYPTSIIAPYTQMTFEQFLFQQDIAYNKNNDFIHTVKVGNLNEVALPANYIYEIKLPSINSTLYTSIEFGFDNGIPKSGYAIDTVLMKPFTITGNADPTNYHIIPFDAIEDTVNIQLDYILRTEDIRIENNTVTRNYEFSNQLAYDDGIADFGYTRNVESAEFAQRYILHERDDIFGLMIHFARIQINQSNRLFSIKIWDKIEGVDGSDTTILLYPKKNPLDPYAEPELLNVEYPIDYNHSGFRLYCLDQQISVSDTFYVGIQQIGDVGIIFGFDKNSQAGYQNLFFNDLNEWSPSTKEGSIMIRPVFDKDRGDCEIDIAVLSTQAYLSDEFEIFPNPVNNYLHINFKESNKVEAIEIFDASGRLLQKYDIFINKIDVSNLTSGIYFVKLAIDGKFGIKKFIKSN